MSSAHDPAVERALTALAAPADSLRRMAAAFREAMAAGLAGQPSSLKMLPTFVEQRPRSTETGRVVVVDWGGTHGRIAHVELAGRGRFRLLAEGQFTFADSDKTGSAAAVFATIAASIGRVLGAEHLGLAPVPLGFVYSYPARMERIDRAIALSLTKGWSLDGLVGHDVAAMLQAALDERGLGWIRIAAVVNDTVSTLAAGTYLAGAAEGPLRPAEIGLIVGTGTNLAASIPGAGIRNLESGNFDRLGDLVTVWDDALDRAVADPAPGAQRLEKMAAGHYTGEILRRIVLDVARCSALFHWAEASFATPFDIDGAQVARLAADSSPELSDIAALLAGIGVASTLGERRALAALARGVARRSARLIASALAGALTLTDPALDREHAIAVDGSVYGGHPGFPDMIRTGLADIVGSEAAARLELRYARESTALGAAVIAARSSPCALDK